MYTCPYCFYQFKEFDIKKSKGGRAEHKHCPNPEVDENGQPVCNHYLPEDFVDHDSTTIAIYGGVNAGKSTYIASLVKFLIEDNHVRNYLKIHVSFLEGDDHSKNQINKYWSKMVSDQSFPVVSDSEDISLRKPIVLSIKNLANYKQIYLTFFDTSGEEFVKMTNIVDQHPHICNADAILFFMDPLQLESMLSLILEDDKQSRKFRFYRSQESKFTPVDSIGSDIVVKNLYSAIRNTQESKLRAEGKTQDTLRGSVDENVSNGGQSLRARFNIYIQEVNALLGNAANGTSIFKVHKPTAFCISKYDLLGGLGSAHFFENIHYFDNELFAGDNPSGNWINSILDEIKESSKRIHDYLHENEAVVYQEIDTNFSNYKIMGVAAAIAEESDVDRVKIENRRPVTKNLFHPLIWVLHELKFFK